MSKKYIEETIEEFLARGGKITKIPPQESEGGEQTVRSTAHTPPTLYSLDLGQLMFAEKRTRKKKKRVDISKNKLQQLIDAARNTKNSEFTRKISDEKQSKNK